MSETQMSLTDLRQHLATVINRAAYGGERIVLVSHGEPKAIIVGVEEWRRLEERASVDQNTAEVWMRAL
jgi:prevent-host-death family protein